MLHFYGSFDQKLTIVKHINKLFVKQCLLVVLLINHRKMSFGRMGAIFE